MKADLTRLTFDPAKHYRAVHQQQGRVQLDSDWNEQADILNHRIETGSLDTVGTCGAPIAADGFRLVSGMASLTPEEQGRPGNAAPNPPPGAGELLLTSGRFYADGILVVNERLVSLTAQPELPTAAELAATGLAVAHPAAVPNAAGTYLAYLDVWSRHRTSLEDPDLLEVALGGPDTTTRTRNSWQVKFIPAPDGTTCGSPLAAWDELAGPSTGRLSAEYVAAPQAASPCIVEPGAGYRRLENQLYRVEVHEGGDTLSQTSFKWSRDNGSVVARWLSKQVGSLDLKVENIGRDKVLGLDANQWVELTDDTREELGLPGVFVEIESVEGDIVRLKAPHLAEFEIARFPRNPRLRRWEGRPAVRGRWLGPDGQTRNLTSSGLFELEDGVAVRFAQGSFRTGDYWLVPARTARTRPDWPLQDDGITARKLPPHGVAHHYCKLAILTLPAPGGVWEISDCRPLFPPLTEVLSLHYVGGDGQSATPDTAQPPTALLPALPLPLEVGVSRGEHPVPAARVRFTVAQGDGQLAGVDAAGITLTDAEGVARVTWSLRNSHAAGGAAAGHRILAELVNSTGTRMHLPISFHASLLDARKVAYDPGQCAEMQAKPVRTVQEALDHLCARHSDTVDCCKTVGEIDGRPGDFPTLKDALEAVAKIKGSNPPALCLSLLPGEHRITDPVSLELSPATVLKIDGCNHAAHLVIEDRFTIIGGSSITLRDIGILMQGSGLLRFSKCALVDLTRNLVRGTDGASPMLAFSGVRRLNASGNVMAALSGTSGKPSPAPGGLPPAIGSYLAASDENAKSMESALENRYKGMTRAERRAEAKELQAAVKAATPGLGARELKAYGALIESLRSAKVTEIASKVLEIREAGAERSTGATLPFDFDADDLPAPVIATGPGIPGGTIPTPPNPGGIGMPPKTAAQLGIALQIEDLSGDITIADNHILGEVRYLRGDSDKATLTKSDLKKLASLVDKKALILTASKGALRVRGNLLGSLTWGSAVTEELKAAAAGGKGGLTVWSCLQFSGNRTLSPANHFAAQLLIVDGNAFREGSGENDGTLLATRATLSSNLSLGSTGFNNLIQAGTGAANLGLQLHPPL